MLGPKKLFSSEKICDKWHLKTIQSKKSDMKSYPSWLLKSFGFSCLYYIQLILFFVKYCNFSFMGLLWHHWNTFVQVRFCRQPIFHFSIIWMYNLSSFYSNWFNVKIHNKLRYYEFRVVYMYLIAGNIVSDAHKLPQGDWFNVLSSPHQTAEILMYFSITILLWYNITWFFVFTWVLSNQVCY